MVQQSWAEQGQVRQAGRARQPKGIMAGFLAPRWDPSWAEGKASGSLNSVTFMMENKKCYQLGTERVMRDRQVLMVWQLMIVMIHKHETGAVKARTAKPTMPSFPPSSLSLPEPSL
jgi:hypothetical protein